MEKFQERQRNFQKAGDPELYLKRQQFAVSLRKQKRMDSYQLSRCAKLSTNSLAMNEECPGPTDSSEDLEIDGEYPLPLATLPVFANNEANSYNGASLQQLRLAISMTEAPLDYYVSIGIIPLVLPFALLQEESLCKNEALWILCNIASGSNICVQELVKYGGIEIFTNNIFGASLKSMENSLWGIGNILGEAGEYLSKFLENDYFGKLLYTLRQYPNERIQLVAAWGIRNSSHSNRLISIRNTELLLEIADTLLMSPDNSVKADAIQSIVILTREDNDKIEALLGSTFLLHCLEMFELFEVDELLIPQFRIFGNIFTGTVMQAQKLLDMNILDKLAVYIGHQDAAVVKEVYWILSNIAAGTLGQIEILEKHPMFYSSISGILHYDSNVKIEASFFVSNYLKISTRPMRKKLFKNGIMKTAVEALEFKVPEFVINILCIFEIYIKTEGPQKFCIKGYQKMVDELQTHSNPDVYLKTVNILEKLLGMYEEDN